MRYLAVVLMGLALALCACESTNQPLSPSTVAGASLSRTAPDLCLGGVPHIIETGHTADGQTLDPPLFYCAGSYPVNCENHQQPIDVGRLTYKLYFLLADGRKMLYGVDNHPFTVSTSNTIPPTGQGPWVDIGNQPFWTFVISSNRSLPPLQLLLATEAKYLGQPIMLIELWGPGGKIGETRAVLDSW